MTELTEAQRDRLAKLDRPIEPRTKRRRHAAQGSRIVAAGLGAGTMFGIVTVLGMNSLTSQAEAPTPEPQSSQTVVAPPVEVRVHLIPASTAVADREVPIEVGTPAQVDSTPARPIELTANPVVRTITVAAPAQARAVSQAAPSAPAPQAAPVATTSGSS